MIIENQMDIAGEDKMFIGTISGAGRGWVVVDALLFCGIIMVLNQYDVEGLPLFVWGSHRFYGRLRIGLDPNHDAA